VFHNLHPDNIEEYLKKQREEVMASYAIPEYAKNDLVCVDIGANVGSFIVYAAHRRPFTKIYAYEPVKENIGFLERVKSYLSSITHLYIKRLAVHTQSGQQINLYTPSVYSDDVYVSEHPRGASHIKIQDTCKTISLSDVIKTTGEIDYLKVDCEGAEYDIFECFSEFDKIKVLSMELHYGEEFVKKRPLLELLQKHFIFVDIYRYHTNSIYVTNACINNHITDLDFLAKVNNITCIHKQQVNNVWFPEPPISTAEEAYEAVRKYKEELF